MPARRRDYPCKGPPECKGRTPLKWGYCPACTAALAEIRRALEAGPRQGDAARREYIHRRRAAGVNEARRP